jgi:hypothetical protein
MINPCILVIYAIVGWFRPVIYVTFNHLSTCNRIRLVIKWHFWHCLFLLTFTILPTKLTLLSSLHQISLLCIKWKVFYIIYIPFLFTSQTNSQNFKSWLIFSTPKTTSCSRMWKPDGSTCFFKKKKCIEYH